MLRTQTRDLGILFSALANLEPDQVRYGGILSGIFLLILLTALTQVVQKKR